jgi:ribosomal protein S18 acetylase RimI-like enzyme
MMVKILDATVAEIPLIREIAEITWKATYTHILTSEQLGFMLNAIYSPEELEKVMIEGAQKFLILKDNQGYQGFASFGARKEEPGVFKLHKIYILPQNQGKGYGSLLIEEIKRRLTIQGIRLLDLNVNRNNEAKEFYKKLGFKIIREEDIPIGQYWMNDYVMRLTIVD